MHLIRSSYRVASWIALIGLLITFTPTIPHRADTPAKPTVTASPLARLPASLIPQMNSDLATDDPAYAIAPLAGMPATLRAADTSQRTTATFTAAGVTIAGQGDASWHLRLAAFDNGALTLPMADTTPVADGARVEYRRAALSEWYINGPMGIEQGFTLAAPPAAGDTVALALAVTGARPTPAGDHALLTLPGGEVQRYGGLTATDARSQHLPARLTVVGDIIRINVETAGATWPVTVDPFVETHTFAANDAASTDGLGNPVAVDTAGDVVVAAAKHKTIGNKVVGEVYIWHVGNPSTIFQIPGSSFGTLSGFGYSVAVSGDGKKVAIGVPNLTSDWPHEGSVLVYGYSAPVYNLIATLKPDPCSCQIQLTNAAFGAGVAMNQDGSIIAVGAPGESVVIQNVTFPGVGAVYLEYGTGYSSQREYFGDLPGGAADQGGEAFGSSVALDANGATLTVGEPNYNSSGGGGSGGGAIDVYSTSGTGSRLALLTASDAGTDDQLGACVAVSADGTVVIGGAPYQIDAFNLQGAAYVFSGANYGAQKKLLATNPADSDYFGYSVAVNGTGDTVAVGTFNTNKVFVYSGGYTLSQTINGNTPSTHFGDSVALSADGGTLVIGAPGEADGAISRAGIVHILTQQVPIPLPPAQPPGPTHPGPMPPIPSRQPPGPTNPTTPNPLPGHR